MDHCKKCGSELTPGMAFCAQCGARAETPPPDAGFCAQCGAPLVAGAGFCGQCGAAAPPPPGPAAVPEPHTEPEPPTEPEMAPEPEPPAEQEPAPEPGPITLDEPVPAPEPGPITLDEPAPAPEPAPITLDEPSPAPEPGPITLDEPAPAPGPGPITLDEPAPAPGPVPVTLGGAAPAGQALCTHCGAPLSQEMAFCAGCGAKTEAAAPAPVCLGCGAAMEPGIAFCPRCGRAAAATAPAADVPPAGPAPARNLKTLWIALGAVAAVAVLTVVVVLIVSAVRGGGAVPVAYLKDNRVQLLQSASGEPVELDEEFFSDYFGSVSDMMSNEAMVRSLAQFTDDGKRLVYISGDRDGQVGLYYCDLKPVLSGKVSEGTRLESSLGDMYVLVQGGKYILYKNDELRLYIHDFEEKTLIAKDVASFRMTKDERTLYFMDQDGSLYVRPLTPAGEREKVDGDVLQYFLCGEGGDVLYVKDSGVYLKRPGKEKDKLYGKFDRGTDTILSVYEGGAFYFTRTQTQQRMLSDFVKDDQLAADQAMAEPVYHFTVPAPLITDFAILDPDSGEIVDYDYDAYYDARDDYSEQVQAYDEAFYQLVAQWNEKLMRDELRLSLETSITLSSTALYYFDGEQALMLGEDTQGGTLLRGVKKPVLVFRQYPAMEDVSIPLSQISYAAEVENQVGIARQAAYGESGDLQLAVAGAVTAVGDEDATGFQLNETEQMLYYLGEYDSRYGEGTLMAMKVSVDARPEAVDENVNLFLVLGGRLVYGKDGDSVSGDLYEGGKLLVADIFFSSLSAMGDGNSLIGLTDYSERSGLGTLVLIRAGQYDKISDDVYDAYALSEKRIYFLFDYDKKNYEGELRYYDGSSKTKLIDEDVSLLFRPALD